ncbi:MAG: DUF3578 domain-containing protein, partial [Burkholderiales bacterium]|nr:DUF3578 domain-containing protein [Burkholderiales bacterium]
MTIQSALQHIFSVWQVEKNKPFAKNSLANYITTDFKNAITASSPQQIENYKIAASAGKGAWADVPWLSILNEKITNTTSDGIYPAYLFCADGSGVYLNLMLGTEVPQEKLGKPAARRRATTITNYLYHEIEKLHSWDDGAMDLKSQASRARSYEYAKIGWKFYPASNLPSEDELQADLHEILDIYAQIEPLWVKEFATLEISEEVQKIAAQIPPKSVPQISANTMHKINLPKPFLLLAGISGTGKSRFVREQARVVDPDLNNFLLIPVRPDWHEPSDLMGYVSRINGEEYVATDFLKFIVKAWLAAVASSEKDSYQLKPLADIPSYWLCLDEMNLAPVEQYFAVST